jgi:acyl-CoA synthetase (AMP-forming)/AMP-acid ligase II
VTVGDPNADPETACRTVGRAIEGTEVIIGGPDGAPLPPGSSGEVLVRGYNVMRGYFNDADATDEAIDRKGWLHTGDVGVMDAAGNVTVTDRLKDMYVTGGFNVYPAEVEAALRTHPSVGQVAVIGVPESRMGEVGLAVVVPAAGVEATGLERELIDWSHERLANFKVPRSVHVVEELPTNASGKVLKRELRRQFATPVTSAAGKSD